MKFKIFFLGFLVTTLLISCKNSEKEIQIDESVTNTTESTKDTGDEISGNDREQIIANLQGEWKEAEYPFRVAHFKDTRVKFIEEGVVEEPVFMEYKILKECPFSVNNIKNLESDDIILAVVNSETCEKIELSNNTLTLSGFSVHTECEYNIVYKKVE